MKRKGRFNLSLTPLQCITITHVKNQKFINLNFSESQNIQILQKNQQQDTLSQSQQIEPAIKSMQFRKERGTKMRDLMNKKFNNDNFWQRNQNYFGGNLNFSEDESYDEDYEQSSSGQDSFDSDFGFDVVWKRKKEKIMKFECNDKINSGLNSKQTKCKKEKLQLKKTAKTSLQTHLDKQTVKYSHPPAGKRKNVAINENNAKKIYIGKT